MTAKLRIVTGKGGVGKTTVAAAMAWAAARAGQRVLLAETHAGNQASALLGAAPTGPVMREVMERLHVVDLDPQEAIHEYALLVLRFETVYRAVFGNPLVKHFIRLVPSLGELTLLGKLWFHAQEEIDGGGRFDLIVLDAPATGHAIAMLRSPAGVANTVPAGPLRDNCQLIQDMLSDTARTSMHIVTTPEEMPVNEAVELEQAAEDLLRINVGVTFINQRVPALGAGAWSALDACRDPRLDAPRLSLKIREDKVRAGESHLARLPSHMLKGACSLPRLVGDTFGRDQIDLLAGHIAQHALAEHWW